MDDARRDLERSLREVRVTLANRETERDALAVRVAEQDQRLAQLATPSDDGDLLALYRSFLAAWEHGGDVAAVAARIHHRERIITLTAAAEQRAVQIADRHLAELATHLDALHRLVALPDDPKRFRPRLFSSAYEFKQLSGQISALHDAAQALFHSLRSAQRAYGLKHLAKQAPKLRGVFREMVGLVAQWRLKLGDPPPASISVSIDGGSGVTALPGALASDVELMLRKRNRLGPAAQELAAVLEGCVALYHQILVRALGEPIPRPVAAKREAVSATLARLSGELAALVGRCERAFPTLAAGGLEPAPGDAALVSDDHLLRLALAALDGACQELATLPNAPTLNVSAVPARSADPGVLATAARERLAWLDLLLRYRVVTTEA
jgi:hypothetical protein